MDHLTDGGLSSSLIEHDVNTTTDQPEQILHDLFMDNVNIINAPFLLFSFRIFVSFSV